MIFDRIKKVRELLGFSTQEEFSTALEVPNRTYQSYEQGKVKAIPHTFLEKLNKQYLVSLDWLLTGNGVTFEEPNNQEIKTSNFSKLINEELKNLSDKQKEYYYHRIKSDVLENELKYKNV